MRAFAFFLALVAVGTLPSAALAEEVMKMPPRTSPPQGALSTVVPASLEHINTFSARSVRLADLDTAEKLVTSSENQIGIGRALNIVASESRTSGVRLKITSPGANFIRIAVEILGDGEYRITAVSPTDDSAPVALVVSPAGRQNLTWTPVTKGDTQDLLVERIDAAGPINLVATKLSHMSRLGIEGQAESGTKGFGDSAYCQSDFKCAFDAAPQEMRAGLIAIRDSVAWMVYTKQDGQSYVCTGTLLNTENYPLPIFLTAYHCMSDPVAVASLTTFWFYHRDVCGSGPSSNTFTQLAGGATALSLVPQLDAALIGLNQFPPQGARYGGWKAVGVSADSYIFAAHHPAGDALKASFGSIVGSNPTTVTIGGVNFAPNTFHVVDWLIGVVEGGSSGSSVFTYDPQSGYFHSRGTLTGGSATCNSGTPRTYYSRLELFYPYISNYLVVPLLDATTTAVEYYHSGFGHYFVTAQSDEIAGLDSGVFAGWSRTGQSWKVWTSGIGKVDVCRFFTTAFAPKSSHFYTANAAECALVKSNPAWTYEKIAFKVGLPASGVCANGSKPLYRLYNNGSTGAPNHRYTTSTTILNQMIANGFVQELDNTVCVPN